MPVAILEHQMDLERLNWIADVEKTRHVLLLDEKRREKCVQNRSVKKRIVPLVETEEEHRSYLMQKCVALFTRKLYCSVHRRMSVEESNPVESIFEGSFREDSRNVSPTFFRANSSIMNNQFDRFSTRNKLMPSYTVPDLTKLFGDTASNDSGNLDPYELELNLVRLEKKVLLEGVVTVRVLSKNQSVQLYAKVYPRFVIMTKSSSDATPRALFNRAYMKLQPGRHSSPQQSNEKQITFAYKTHSYCFLVPESQAASWLKCLNCFKLLNGTSSNGSCDSK